MPSKTPFLMGNGEGATTLGDAAFDGPAAAPPTAAPHAAAREVFRKSRRDDGLLITILQGLESETKSKSQQSKVKGKRQKAFDFQLSTFDSLLTPSLHASLSRSIFASHSSSDWSISSHVTSLPR